MTPGATSLTYTPFNNVESIQKGVRHRVDFTYGPERARLTRTDTARTNKGRSTTTGTKDKKAVTVAWEYDARGRRTAVADPHWPAWRATRYRYTWNGFDELIEQTDRLGNRLVMTYDALGRRTTRTDTQSGGRADEVVVATWRYDNAANGLGRPGRVTQRVGLDTEQDSYRRTHAYDRYGRESDTTLTVQAQGSAKTYHTRQTYDEYGRPHRFFDAARQRKDFTDNVTEVQYNARGHAHQWTDGVYVSGQPRRRYRTIESVDARGQVTDERLGGGVVSTRRTHDARTGRITGITSRDALRRPVQRDTYGWDVLGNLTGRSWQRGNKTVTESFTYDPRNRLTKAGAVLTTRAPLTNTMTTQTLTPQEVSYDALGNITEKSDVGTYTYGAEHPHAVTATRSKDTTTTPYAYDVQGNQLFGAGRTLAWTAFNKVKRIERGVPHRVDFTYGPDRSRITRTDTARTGGVTSVTTTVYLGNVEHVIAADGSSSYKRTLAGGSVLITRDHDKTGKQTGETTRYLLKDHLGSLSRILDKHGSATQSFSYDAWGQRRHPHDAGMPASLTLSSPIHSRITPRGFTGHEMLDAVGLIHMNGRIYDPTLGRFLQADPVIQFPHYSQGQNPYSYVLNNPLTYTDPSGYFIGKLFKKVFGGLNKALGDFSPFLGIALLALPGMQPWVMQSWGHAFGFGFITGGIATGSLKGALFGGISVAAFVATGSQFVAETGFFQQGGLGHVLTHGITGGILAELQGGQFGHGFLAAGLSKAVMGRFSYADGSAPAVLGRTAVAATVGGTISRITGGKFANGALTSAMAQLFNAETSAARAREYVEKMRRTVESLQEHIKQELQSMKDKYIPDLGRAMEIGDKVLDAMPGHNNSGDANRHAVWSHRMYQEINPVTSYTAGYLYELENLLGGQPINEMLMDLHNNAVGRAAAASGTMVDQSRLIVVDPSEPYIDAVTQY